MRRKKLQEQKREMEFAARTVTRIWNEEASEANPYLAAKSYCHGYDLIELMRKRSFVDVLFLLFNGELPSPEQARLLETLMIAFVNPGPRHPAVWAVMNAAVSKTDHAHFVPIGLSVLGGEAGGAGEVGRAMRFFRRQIAADTSPKNCAQELLTRSPSTPGDWHIAPGFGSRFGGIDPWPQRVIEQCQKNACGGIALRWGCEFAAAVECHGLGWLPTGVVAAVLCDLGFDAKAGAGLFQIFSAPGLLAHGVEFADKAVESMPFLVGKEHYVIAAKARAKKS